MKRINSFFRTSLLGGTVVILPVAILVFIFKWLFDLITDLIQPLTDQVLLRSQLPEITADVIVILIIIMVCFIVGALVKTSVGGFVHRNLENHILKIAPGYSLIKETVEQFLGRKDTPFSSVALARIFGNDTLVSSFVTDRHKDGSYSVFVPTGPNPTSGNIYHLKGEYVFPVDVPVEDAMRSIISCGAGSDKLIEAYSRKMKARDLKAEDEQ